MTCIGLVFECPLCFVTYSCHLIHVFWLSFWQVVSGGVASNQYFRHCLRHVCDMNSAALICPPQELCTDNGIMVAWWVLELWQLYIPYLFPSFPCVGAFNSNWVEGDMLIHFVNLLMYVFVCEVGKFCMSPRSPQHDLRYGLIRA